MTIKRSAICVTLATFVLVLTVAGWAAELVLVRFTGTNGSYPFGTPVFDSAGNLYGTTSSGGPNGGLGTVFELSPIQGGWNHTILYTFNPSQNPMDGSGPYAGVILDSAGNLYGATQFGGGTEAICPSGCGTVFKLTPSSQGTWDESILYRFQGGSDGASPHASLLLGPRGELYGTTQAGGSTNCVSGCGTVFKLFQTQSGSWHKTILHTFMGSAQPDGGNPSGPLVFDNTGNLYGTTFSGGRSYCTPDGCGTVFEFTPTPSGLWQYHVIHDFGDGEGFGINPAGGVVVDGAGNLYGTTSAGTNINQGSLFELSPDGLGNWIGKMLHKFHTTAGRPYAPLILDVAGGIHATTLGGGRGGTAFGLTSFSAFGAFKFNQTDGAKPYSGLVSDSQGNLYGATSQGGGTGLNAGVVFELTQ